MAANSATRAAAGRIGGLRKAALAPSRASLTSHARDARWQRYRDQVPQDIDVPPGSTLDAEIDRRAELLRKADMAALSLKAAKARRLGAELRALNREMAGGNAGAVSPADQARTADVGA